MLPPSQGAFSLAAAGAYAWLPRTCFPPLLWGFGSPIPIIYFVVDRIFTLIFSSSYRSPEALHLQSYYLFCKAFSSTPSFKPSWLFALPFHGRAVGARFGCAVVVLQAIIVLYRNSMA